MIILNKTLGVVVANNDPTEMGRLKVVCAAWGDSFDTPVSDLPWAVYCSPFAGDASVGARSPNQAQRNGRTAYGLWAIPTLGAQVLVECLDGDPSKRIYTGCVFNQMAPHSMPHGRFIYDDHPLLGNKADGPPAGPLASNETKIQPLHDNLAKAFRVSLDKEFNFEFASRGADRSVAAIPVDYIAHTESSVGDDSDRNGYNQATSLGEKESSIVSLTSPGFHAFSMDDNPENCRIRLRTSTGHQILMDDTNERIYISTNSGNAWVEMDSCGNIDVYSARNISLKSDRDINLVAGKTIRLTANEGIHLHSNKDVRANAGANLYLSVTENVGIVAGQHINNEAGSDVNLIAGGSLLGSGISEVGLMSGVDLKLSAGGGVHESGQTIYHSGGSIYQNVFQAATATSPTARPAVPAMVASRTPSHEPWARTMTANDFTLAPEFQYRDDKVGRQERGEVIERGQFWKR